jgi:hypothetical protein
VTIKKIIEELESFKKENDIHTIYEGMYVLKHVLEDKGIIPRSGKYENSGNPFDRNGIIYLIDYIQTACSNAVREFKRDNMRGYSEDLSDAKKHLKPLITEILLANAKPASD